MTGALFLTGNRQDHMDVSASGKASFTIHAPLVDAANPFIFVDSATMPQAWHERALDEPDSFEIIEAIRCEGAVKIGLASDIHSARPRSPDIFVNSYSMGKVHPSFQLTGAVCLSAAVSVPGTIASQIPQRRTLPISPPGTPPSVVVKDVMLEPYGRNAEVVIAHSSGTMMTDIKVIQGFDTEIDVQSVSISRTARCCLRGMY
ncbi:hypothetical protein ACEPPN_019308 [Leptodophora sp. 'Broadleaf-Isolate-01']